MTLSEIEERLGRLKEEMVKEMTKLLKEARSQCKYGEWKPWLRKIGIGCRMAQNYLKEDGQAVIYLVRLGKLVKVGRTVALNTRLAAIRREHGDVELLGTIPGHFLEYKLHQELKPFHAIGEWYELTHEQTKTVLEQYRKSAEEYTFCL